MYGLSPLISLLSQPLRVRNVQGKPNEGSGSPYPWLLWLDLYSQSHGGSPVQSLALAWDLVQGLWAWES